MKTYWKRWKITLGTSIDNLVNRVENHEALISAAIREAQAATAKARVKLAHVHRDGERMRQRIYELTNAVSDWEQRARQLADSEHDRALECLRRRNRARQELQHLEAESTRHTQTEQALASDIRKLDQHIEDLKCRKNTLAARDFRARAMTAGQHCEDSLLNSADDIFERWELKLAETECVSSDPAHDPFEDEFITREETASLEAELECLRGKK